MDLDGDGDQDAAEETTALDTHGRYARVPGRGLESRLRYWAHRYPTGLRMGGMAAVLGTGILGGFLASLGTFFAYLYVQGRLHRPFDLLVAGDVEEAEAAARKALEGEEPGPVADEYLTLAAIARACQGDREGARELMERREAPISDLWALHPRLHRPFGAAAFDALGEPELALDLMQEVEAATAESGLVLLKVATQISARRYRDAQRDLAALVARVSTPAVLHAAHGLFVTLAWGTWDREVEKLLRDFEPKGYGDQALRLDAKIFLAEIRGERGEARALVQKVLAVRAEETGFHPSEEFMAWHADLYGAYLEAEELSDEELERALASARRTGDRIDGPERESTEALFLEGWIECCLALRRGDPEGALLPEARPAALHARGGALRGARILLLACELDDPTRAAEEVLLARREGGESPGIMAAAARVRELRGKELDPEDRLALARARYAARLFPPGVRRHLGEAG